MSDDEVTLYTSQAVRDRSRYTAKGMTKVEHDQLRNMLEMLEMYTLWKTGMRRISGGYAEAHMQSYNGKSLRIQLKYGVSSDCQRSKTVEWYRAPRTMLAKCDKTTYNATCMHKLLGLMHCFKVTHKSYEVEGQ